AVQVPPPAPTHVQTGEPSEAGAVSVTVAPVTAVGPLLVATMVYVIAWPATAVLTPSVFVIARSVPGVIVSTSVALLFPAIGSNTVAATVAVFESVPLAVVPSVPVA